MVSGHPGDVSNSGEFSFIPGNYLSQSVLPFPPLLSSSSALEGVLPLSLGTCSGQFVTPT